MTLASDEAGPDSADSRKRVSQPTPVYRKIWRCRPQRPLLSRLK